MRTATAGLFDFSSMDGILTRTASPTLATPVSAACVGIYLLLIRERTLTAGMTLFAMVAACLAYSPSVLSMLHDDLSESARPRPLV